MFETQAAGDVDPAGENANSPATNLKVAWWNTRLTPPGSPSSSLKGKDRILALDTIRYLAASFDVVTLGEVSSSDLLWLSEHLPDDQFSITDLTKGSTRSFFNIGVITKKLACQMLDQELLTDKVGGQNFKIAAHFQLLFAEQLVVNVLAVHWSSRITKQEGNSDRTHFGNSLRKRIDQITEDGFQHIIVLGDFNDEPFDTPVTNYLRATRDAKFLKDQPELLYNPFWKSLVCRVGYSRVEREPEPTGTYFYRRDGLHRWRVFDQILFSSAFIGGSDWHLEETGTGVLRLPRLMDALEDRKSKIDHLPIFCTVSKEAANGELQRQIAQGL